MTKLEEAFLSTPARSLRHSWTPEQVLLKRYILIGDRGGHVTCMGRSFTASPLSPTRSCKEFEDAPGLRPTSVLTCWTNGLRISCNMTLCECTAQNAIVLVGPCPQSTISWDSSLRERMAASTRLRATTTMVKSTQSKNSSLTKRGT